MPTLLHIDSSPRHASVSSSLSHQFVDSFVTKHAGTTVVHHNTTNETLPFLTEQMVNAGFTPEAQRSPEMKESLAVSDKLAHELLDADTLVIGVPMWNFGVPASLKAWIDLVVRAGLTFQYGPAGASGLIPAGKKVYVFASRGGDYSANSPAHAYDMQEPYLRGVFGFLGLTDVTFVIASNQSRGPEAAKAGLEQAQAELAALLG